jgi:phosphorylase kinase alpha/beta subunit
LPKESVPSLNIKLCRFDETRIAAMPDEEQKTKDALERSSKLPEEIFGAHEARADFLKWKLVLVAALGAAGLGIGDKFEQGRLLLALIPLVCIYADLLCTNLKVRVIVIGSFYSSFRGDGYERFAQRNRKVFDTEAWALHYSTYVVCIILTGIGLFSQTFDELSWRMPFPWKWPWQWPANDDLILIVAGLAGLLLSVYTNKRSERLIDALAPPVDSDEVQNIKMGGLLRADYTAAELKELSNFLAQKGVFIFKSLPNGLFAASGSAGAKDVSGYQYVWVRDNVHVAHAHYVCGDAASAARNITALMTYFQKHQDRFQSIIDDKQTAKEKRLAADPMNRPHIRFDGRNLAEIKQKWGHAQNDALGYFLWCYCKLAREGVIHPDDSHLRCLIHFPRYFDAIKYWQDEDSGHWEEARKVLASSIGTVIAGLREFESLLEKNPRLASLAADDFRLESAWRKKLREEGASALKRILPCESVEPEECYRRFDSALLFLIYPLEVLSGAQAQAVLEDIKTHLQGDCGIRRYLGDSYWFPDYKKHISKWKRTGNFSGTTEERDAHVRLGEEAQWCIFDPIMSVVYGRMYLLRKQEGKTKEAGEYLQLQTAYFNRSLRQLTIKSKNEAGYRAPEAYYLEDGHYVPNDHTPLLWTQANLWLAVNQMRQSVESRS